MRGQATIRSTCCALACAGALVATAVPAVAQGSYPYNESPSAALARYVHTLADAPKDFSALVGAGRAALELGDTQVAAGFFARADEANPRSPLPQAGMGAISVANGDAKAALPYFARAQQLGAPVAMFGADRGLAYDLLGRQAQAQADYRTALGGVDGDEARCRLALSLAISGDRAGALETLAPLVAKGDADGARARAFVLALTGDSNGAMVAIDSAMPGSWARVAPFLQRLPSLQAGQKAAAVNLGIFPDSSDTAYAYATPTANYAVPTPASVVLRQDSSTAPQPMDQPAPAEQLAYAAPVASSAVRAVQNLPQEHKLWLQLASGQSAGALPGQFRRLKSQNRELFDGIPAFVAQSPDRVRLVIGPFHGPSDARIFADDLQSVGISAFSWTNSESDRIVPIGAE